MELRHLRYFSVLARTLHFARAADELGIAQSALSVQIQALEREVGSKLFDRSNKWNIQLTAAGRALLPEAKDILEQTEAALKKSRAAAEGHIGRLSIGVVSSMLNQKRFIEVIHSIYRQTPAVTLDLRELSSDRMLKMLGSDLLDLCIMRPPEDLDAPEYKTMPLFRDRFIFAIPRGHRLAARKSISVPELARELFITVPESEASLHRKRFEELCRNRGGFTPLVVQEIANVHTIIRILCGGGRISLVPEAFAGECTDFINYIPPEGGAPVLPVYAIWRREDNNPVLKRFLSVLEKKFASSRFDK